MASLIPGYEYDLFISYRQKDNKGDRWISEFVDDLKTELESTFKEDISIYFDENPHDGLLETHNVDKSLETKLKCLIFIPVISQTYCDPKSFAWQNEFCTFNKLIKNDSFGKDIRLASGNVAGRILPVKIHDLDPEDNILLENELGGPLRGIEFIYREAGVNRPLKPDDDTKMNLNKTHYRNQVNKVANAVKEIITALKKHSIHDQGIEVDIVNSKTESRKYPKSRILIMSAIVLLLIVPGYFVSQKLFKHAVIIEKSIAVLPFINDSPSDSTLYFIDGVMDEILTNLQSIKELRVISRTSVGQYRGEFRSTIPEIAKKLNVNYIVEGTGQKFGNNFRLRVQLIRADKESYLWSKPYERVLTDANDIFKIQSQIAEDIAAELEAVITPQEKDIIDNIPTRNLPAYEAYLQGIFHARKFTQHDAEVALQYFEQAIEKDPLYAPAYAGICNIWEFRESFSFASPSLATPRAKAALEKALELDSSRAEVFYSLSNIETRINWDWKAGEKAVKKAIALNPNYADAYSAYSNYLLIVGRIKESIENVEYSLKLDPLNPLSKANYGQVLLFSRRFQDAVRTYQEVLEIDPANVLALGNLPIALHMVGKYKEELEAWKSYFTGTFKEFNHVFDEGYSTGGFAGSLNLEADTLAAQSKVKYINPCEIALVYASAGNKKRTMDMLALAYEVRDPNIIHLSHPGYDIVRSDPRFKELSRKMNIPYK